MERVSEESYELESFHSSDSDDGLVVNTSKSLRERREEEGYTYQDSARRKRNCFIVLGVICIFILLIGGLVYLAVVLSKDHSNEKDQNEVDYVKSRTQLVKSPGDEKDYRLLLLENDISVLLISNPKADRAAACIDVGVGSLSDPPELNGLAHFLEHMLFMGTEKYPEENSYAEYLSDNGGRFNAYTALENTNYYFDVNFNALNETLDRFSQFFISPLIRESSMNREVLAVNSENSKNLENDDWRFYQLLKSLSVDGNPFRQFSTGNSFTLVEKPQELGINVHQELLKFYQLHYYAKNMRGVVLGRESLDELENIVVPKFVKISNDSQESKLSMDPPFTSKQLGKIIFLKPISEKQELTIIWPLESLQNFVKEIPLSGYISNLLGHEGEGSILSLLKSKSYATALSSGLFEDTDYFSLFGVSIELTSLGVLNYPEVISIVYDYLFQLKLTEPQSWIFDENKQIDEFAWNFPDESSPINLVSFLASRLQVTLSAKDILGSPSERVFDSQLIASIIKQLSIQNCLIFVTNKHDFQFDQKEYWYQTEYSIRQISEAELHSWKGKSNSLLFLPSQNPYITKDASLISIPSSVSDVPYPLTQEDSFSAWYKWELTFREPKAAIFFHLLTPFPFKSLNNFVLSNLFLKYVNEAISEKYYPAQIVGYTYSLELVRSGFNAKFYGFNEKISVLVNFVLHAFSSRQFDETTFNIIKEKYLLDLENSLYNDAWIQSLSAQQVLLWQQNWNSQEIFDALTSIEYQDFVNSVSCLLETLKIEQFSTGNILPETSLKLAKEMKNILVSRNSADPACVPPPQNQYEIKYHSKVAQLHPSSSQKYIFKAAQTNPQDLNSALTVYFQLGKINANKQQDIIKKAYFDYISFVINEPFFNQLRTIETLGYIVRSIAAKHNDVYGIFLQVQSSSSPDFLQERVTNFLQNIFPSQVTQNFNEILQSLIQYKSQKSITLIEDANKFWNEILTQQYVFNRTAIETTALKQIVPNQLLKEYQALFSSGLFVQIYGSNSKDIVFNDIQTFKESLSYS